MSDVVVPPFTSDHTVFASLARNARECPNKPALISGRRILTYAEFVDQVGKVAGALSIRGIRAGDRVAVETDDTVQHLVGLIGAMVAGAIAVALPADRKSYRAICEDSQPALVVCMRPNDTDGRTRVQFEDLVASAPTSVLPRLNRSVTSDEIAMLYYTSGTSSGVRKGVMQSYGQLHATVNYITTIMRMAPEICEFVASPPDNAFWFGRCRCILHVGGTALLSSGTLNPFSIISAIERNNGNAIGGDTAVFMLMLHHMEKHLVRVAHNLRWVKIASAPMPIEDKRRLLEILPEARIVFNYGLTEAMRTCLNSFRDNPGKLNSVGRPCPSVGVRVTDAEGHQLPIGQIGEVMIRGDNLASGYWCRPDMWASRFQDGWYRSGDVGYFDHEGFLYLKGRMDHAVNSGGKTIALSEVESLLRPFLKETTYVACESQRPKRRARRCRRTRYRGRVEGGTAMDGATHPSL